MNRSRVATFALPLVFWAIPGSSFAQDTEPPTGSDPTIEEWEVPWERSRPRDPYVAPDGRVWFGTDVNTAGRAVLPPLRRVSD